MKLFSKSTVRVQTKSAICCMFPVQPVVNVLFWQSHFVLTWGGWVAFSKINSVAVLTTWPLKSPDKVHQHEGTASKDALAGAWLTFPVGDTRAKICCWGKDGFEVQQMDEWKDIPCGVPVRDGVWLFHKTEPPGWKGSVFASLVFLWECSCPCPMHPVPLISTHRQLTGDFHR